MQLMPGGAADCTMSRSLVLLRSASSVSSSYALSKWSSIARLLRPVMKIISVMPAATASSTAYWISGLSTIGSISFGCAFVARRKRPPKTATGNTAFLIVVIGLVLSFCVGLGQQREQACFVEHRYAELLGLG